MCLLIFHFVLLVRVIIIIHIATPWLEISSNVKVRISSKVRTIRTMTVYGTIYIHYWVDFLSSVGKQKRRFIFIFLMCSIRNPLTGGVSSKHIPIFCLTNSYCRSLITTFSPKGLSIHSMLWSLKEKCDFWWSIFLVFYSLN